MDQKNTKIQCCLIVTFLLLMTACNLPAPTKATQSEPSIAPTLTSQAVEAMIKTQLAPTLTQVPTQAAIQPSQVPVLSPTQQATVTVTPTQNPSIEFCTDMATFVANGSVTDGTLFSPGATFTKTWRLRNSGTCAWTPQYKLSFTGGDKMNNPGEIPLAGYVEPDSTVELSVKLTAPSSNGSYQGQWMIRSADGKLFGIGKQAEKPFWVKITVAQSVSDLNLGTPTWIDNFKDNKGWYLVDTPNTKFSIKNENMIMEAFNPGKAEEWGLATVPEIKNFYLEATFKTGEACSGKDRYGVLVRAPDPNKGYVFGFTCDGRFRLYKWDGTNYTALEEWKQSTAIVSGPNQTNSLGIQVDGSKLKLYANGKLLGEYTDPTYSKGRFGLFIGSGETEDFTVFVKDIAYWLIGE
jgi:hypothetical protein